MKKTEKINLKGDAPYKKRMFEFIIDLVCAYYGEDKEVLEIKTRRREVIRVKHAIVYLSNKNVRTGPSELGRFYGFNHANVIHIVKKTNDYLTWDADLVKEFNEMQQMITHKSIELNERLSGDNYYFVDMDNVKSFKISEKKVILLTGFTEEESKEFVLKNNINIKPVEHKKTGLYIFEKNEKNYGNKIRN